MSTDLSMNDIANLYNAYGRTLSESISDVDYHNWAKRNHHTEDDFDEGDIEQRIESYPVYVLKLVELDEIDLDGFYHNTDISDEFVEQFFARAAVSSEPFDGLMPPLLHRVNTVRYSVVDGIHRLQYLKKIGLRVAFCYVNPTE